MAAGQVFGSWMVLRVERIDGRIKYLCRCSCGTERLQHAANLTSGRSSSCGCAKRESLVGSRYGRLVVIAESLRKGSNGAYLQVCSCDCGNTVEAERTNLKIGHTRSCGCLAAEATRERNTTHNLSRHPLYPTWNLMHQRCYNPKNKAYLSYGGRGIKVCKRWHSFEKFLEDVGERPAGKTLDREDNDGDYSTTNFRWATQVEQSNNKSTNQWLTARGKTRTTAQWTRLLGLKEHTIYNRLRLGWTPEQAIFGKD